MTDTGKPVVSHQATVKNKFKFFFRQDCPKCGPAKEVVEQLKAEGYPVELYDLDTVDGLAEGAFFSIMATPTLILVDDLDEELAAWRGGTLWPELIKKTYTFS